MDDLELLRAVYRAVAWEKLCRTAPDASRERVDELFRRLAQALECCPEGERAPGPSLRKARLHCDGASRGNPGPAGIGMVLCAADGTEIQAWGMPIGRATSNVAEYRALIAGLERALQLGVREIEVLSDSQLLVRQLTLRYKVKSPRLAPLHEKARSLLEGFQSWAARHVPREENEKADRIAKSFDS